MRVFEDDKCDLEIKREVGYGRASGVDQVTGNTEGRHWGGTRVLSCSIY